MSNNQPDEDAHEEYQQEYVDELEVQESVELDGQDAELMQDSDDNDNDMMISGDDEVIFQDDSVQGFFGHNGEPVYSVAINPVDRNIICSGGGDDTAHLWRSDTGEHLASIKKEHSDSVVSVAFNHDGTLVATGGMDGKVTISQCSPTEGELPQLKVYEGPDEVVWIKWHPLGNAILAGAQDGNVWLWFASSTKPMGVFAKHTDACTCGQFTPDGKSFLTGSADTSLCCWDPRDATSVRWRVSADSEYGKWHKNGIVSMDVGGQDGGLLVATGDEVGEIRVTQVQSGKIVGVLAGGHGDSVECVKFAPATSNLSVLISASMDGTVVIWDLKTMAVRSVLKHEGGVNHAQFVNGDQIVTSTVEKVVTLWNFKSAEKVREWKGHQEAILTMDSGPDYIVTGGDDGVCLIFK